MPRTRPAVLPLNQQRKRNPRTHHAHPTRPAKETGHVIRPLLQQAIRARHRNLAIPLTPTHPARARTALPPRQPATLHLRTDRISRGALPHRARMLHHVPNAREPGHLLRRPPSQATTQPIRIHPRHPNRRHHRRHATGHERRVLPTARLLHETRLPLEIRHGVAGHVPHLAAHRNHPADRHLGHLPMRLPPIRVDDLITNTLGGILGYAMGSIVTHFLPQQRIDEDAITTEPGFVRRCVRSRSTCSLSKRRRCPSRRLSIWLACCSM